ncbi:MAG: phosphopantetheine-binding protein [Jatrophihabitantaceae bacterium]
MTDQDERHHAGISATDHDTESIVMSAWCAALGVTNLEPDVGFFDLGATSADIAMVASRLRQTWPELRTVELFLHPTVDSLVAFLDEL